MIRRSFPDDPDETRRALYRGDIFLVDPTGESQALVADMAVRMEEELGPEPRRAQFRFSEGEFFQRVGRLRKLFYTAPPYHEAVRQIIAGCGWNPDEHAFDPIRLRVVAHRGFENPAAAPVYYGHRDTWYGNPQAQITWWIPLHEIDEAESFVFFPAYFERAVRNDSGDFDYAEWVEKDRRRKIGWQDARTGREALYPQLREEPGDGPRVTITAGAGQILLFSGQHLHRTNRNTTGRTRFSVDFRTVHVRDHAEGIGAPNVDNHSTGSALPDHIQP